MFLVKQRQTQKWSFFTPQKALIEHGYGRLDTILDSGRQGPPDRNGEPVQVLVAPTWGENGLIERHGLEVIKPLIDAGLRVVLRPHPRTRKLQPEILDKIAAYYAEESRFRLDEDADATTSLLDSDIMLSDWSGAALEFSLGLERPIIFADVPRKVLNPEYSPTALTYPLLIQRLSVHVLVLQWVQCPGQHGG